MDEWKEAMSRKLSRTEYIQSRIKGYSYETRQSAETADEKLTEFVLSSIRNAKAMIFDAIQTGFERQIQFLENDLIVIMTELDILSDELMVRVFRMDESLGTEWLERVIEKDYDILRVSAEIEQDAERIRKAIAAFPLNESDGMNALKKLAENVRSGIEKLAVDIKERDSMLNIKRIALEKAFNDARKRIDWRAFEAKKKGKGS